MTNAAGNATIPICRHAPATITPWGQSKMTPQRRPLRINYARPSFIEGMARVLDIGGTLNQHDADDMMEIYQEIRARRLARPTGPEADAAAVRQTWLTVGRHLRDAMGYYEDVVPADAPATEWNDPLPPPEILQQYDAIAPGAANRILAMAENAQQHEIDLGKAASARADQMLSQADQTLTRAAVSSKRGLWFAFIIVLLGIGIGAFLILLGKETMGLAAILTPFAALAGLFVYATETRKAERRRNAANRPEE